MASEWKNKLISNGFKPILRPTYVFAKSSPPTGPPLTHWLAFLASRLKRVQQYLIRLLQQHTVYIKRLRRFMWPYCLFPITVFTVECCFWKCCWWGSPGCCSWHWCSWLPAVCHGANGVHGDAVLEIGDLDCLLFVMVLLLFTGILFMFVQYCTILEYRYIM